MNRVQISIDATPGEIDLHVDGGSRAATLGLLHALLAGPWTELDRVIREQIEQHER